MTHSLSLDHVDFISIFDRFDEGVIIVDHQGSIVYYNDTMAKIDDLTTEYTLGKTITKVYDLNDDTSMIMKCLTTRRPIINQTFFYRTRMGKVANTIHSVFPLLDGDALTGAICFVKDYNILEATIASVSVPKTGGEGRIDPLHTFNSIVGRDPELQRCVNTAQMAANSPSPVMLYGETGTGKELFAQSIHNFSSRKNGKYIAVNCTAIPENLLEGILFGTTKGAFTGALDKPGLLERANGGTLFLDELNSMPTGLQAKMLRVLQEKKVRRLGSWREVDIDLKIISSVNREPHRDIEDHRLRPDLFYRLGVVFIRIPPLRERREDIKILVRHFIDKIGISHGIAVQGVGTKVVDLLNSYDWPGNVRELEHIIEGAMNILGSARTIRLKHLPAYFKGRIRKSDTRRKWLPKQIGKEAVLDTHSDESRQYGNFNEKFGRGSDTTSQSLQAIQVALEENMLREALSRTRGHVTRAAELLGISRQLLHYKLRKLKLNRKDFIPSDL
jgi:arginine utilization regulatory protein